MPSIIDYFEIEKNTDIDNILPSSNLGLLIVYRKNGGSSISRIPHTRFLLWLLPSGPDLMSKKMLQEDP